MVSQKFRRGAATPRRSRRAYYTRRRRHRLGATSTGNGFRSISPQFMRRVKNRPALRHRGYVRAMIRPIVAASLLSALVYGAHYGYQRALTSPALSIQSVRLHQVPNMLIDPVRARLKPAYGANLLALDLVALRASIEELPAVRRASVRRVLPNGLVVSVEAREPKVRVVGEHLAIGLPGVLEQVPALLDQPEGFRDLGAYTRLVEGLRQAAPVTHHPDVRHLRDVLQGEHEPHHHRVASHRQVDLALAVDGLGGPRITCGHHRGHALRARGHCGFSGRPPAGSPEAPR